MQKRLKNWLFGIGLIIIGCLTTLVGLYIMMFSLFREDVGVPVRAAFYLPGPVVAFAIGYYVLRRQERFPVVLRLSGAVVALAAIAEILEAIVALVVSTIR